MANNWAPLNSILANGHRLQRTPSNPLCPPEKLISKYAPLKSEHEIYQSTRGLNPAPPADRSGRCALCLSPLSHRGRLVINYCCLSCTVSVIIGDIGLCRTRSSADADKPARRVWRSVKVTKHSSIPYVRYSFLLCNSNFVFKTRRFYDIRLQKMLWPWNGVKGHSRWYRSIDGVWFPISVF